MANVIQIKRSATHNSTTAPTNLAVGELAYTQGSKELYICRATDNTGGSQIIHAAAPKHGHTDIVTVGTIATGTWNADSIAAGKLPALDGITAPANDLSLNSKKITSLAEPTTDTDAATKGYVDAKAQGLDVKASVRLATTGDLPACTYGQPAEDTGVGATLTANANGALTIDSVAVALNDRILVRHQGTGTESAPHNGIYTVTTLGVTGSAAWVLTRAEDFDENDEVTASAFVFVEEGTVNADSGFVVTDDGAITFASDTFSGVGWSQFSGAGQVTAGSGLTKTGNIINAAGTTNRISVGADAIDIDSAYVGQSTITTLGTVATGTWAATDVAIEHGGTGASSAGDARTNLGLGGAAVLGTGAVADGASTLSTGDQIYDFVIALGYVTASSSNTFTNTTIDCGTF